MSVAEQNRPAVPGPPLQMFGVGHAQHRKPLKSKSISLHCGNWGGTNLYGKLVEGHVAKGVRCIKYKFTAGAWKLVFS